MAETPLQVHLYSSLVTGTSEKHARAFTQPLVELLQEQLHYPIEFALAKGNSIKDLLSFGTEIDQGTRHIGVIWGVEYGWLRKRLPRLEPLVICSEHRAAYRCQVMARKSLAARRFEDLQGVRLATYVRITLMDRAYLQSLLKDENATIKDFFEVKEYPTAQEAVLAVCDEDSDCLVVNLPVYSRLISNRENVEPRLRTVARSGPLPPAVLVGRRDLVNRLRAGLWSDLQDKLEHVHDTSEGKECVTFWRVERFVRPGQDFETLVSKGLAAYPIEVFYRAGSR